MFRDGKSGMNAAAARIRAALPKAGAAGIALVLWQLLAMYIDSPIVIVTPLKTFRALLTLVREPYFIGSVSFTLLRVLLGFGLGLVIGMLLGTAASLNHRIETLLWPYTMIARSVPVAALVVICLIWLSGRNLSVLIVFLVVFPVIYQNVLTGLRVREPSLEEMADVFHMSVLRRLRYIRLPVAAPYLVSACRVTAGMAWKAAAAAEVIGTPAGSIGRQLYLAKTYLATDDLLAWTIVIIVMGSLTEKAIVSGLKALLIRMKCLPRSGREEEKGAALL